MLGEREARLVELVHVGCAAGAECEDRAGLAGELRDPPKERPPAVVGTAGLAIEGGDMEYPVVDGLAGDPLDLTGGMAGRPCPPAKEATGLALASAWSSPSWCGTEWSPEPLSSELGTPPAIAGGRVNLEAKRLPVALAALPPAAILGAVTYRVPGVVPPRDVEAVPAPGAKLGRA